MKFLNLTYVILCISVSFDLVSQSISDEGQAPTTTTAYATTADTFSNPVFYAEDSGNKYYQDVGFEEPNENTNGYMDVMPEEPIESLNL